MDVGLFYLIGIAKGKKISIFLQIWTGKYVYMKSYLHLIRHNPSMPKYPSECTEGQIKNFQNTFDRPWNEIYRMKIQTENYFGILISTRLGKCERRCLTNGRITLLKNRKWQTIMSTYCFLQPHAPTYNKIYRTFILI